MTIANEADRSSPAEAAPSANGAGSLRDRVRSLRLSERGPEARRGSFAALALPWGLCLILAGVAAAFGYYAYVIAPTKAASEAKAQADDPAEKASKSAAESALTSDVASSGDIALEAKGYIIPVHQIMVSPKAAGMLVWLDPRLEEGARFKQGDVLARIEDVDYRTNCTHAQRAYAAAQKRREQARANLVSAQSILDQKLDDFQRAQQSPVATSPSDLNKAKNDLKSQQAAVDALAAAVAAAEADEEAAKADREKAEWNLANCEIKAPVTGTILKKNAEMGNIVNPVAFNIASSLCDMADLSDLEVDLKVQERDIPKVEKGQSCVAMPEAYQNDPRFLKVHPKGYTGKVSRLMPTADRGQGAIPVRVRLDIPKEEEGVYLKPDMGIIVEFLKNER